MIPGLLLPAALGALATLLLPLLIHLARRTEHRMIPFAALRWLAPEPRPRTQITFDERLLLALRLLLLALLALWLAQPVLWNAQDPRAVLAVAPTLGREAISGQAIAGRRAVWLAPGFPPLAGAPPSQSAPLASLIRQLDAELSEAARLELVVPATWADADGERPQLSRAVQWRVLPDPAPSEATALSAPPPALTVRHAPGSAEQVRWFRAAAIAWADPGTPAAIDIDTIARPPPADAGPLVWLAPGPAPEPLAAWVRRGGTVLLAHDASIEAAGEPATVWRDPAGDPLATSRRFGAGRVVQWLRPLEPAAMPVLLDPEFPDVLLRLLQPPSPPARVRAVDYAPMLGAGRPERPRQDLQPWLALALALLFLLERWMATRTRPASAP